MEMRPWLGLSPTSPQHDAGMRIDPPPSLDCATGTMPAATAAALPPLEPPAVRDGSHGLRVGPHASGSVTGRLPNSHEFARANGTVPARTSRSTCALVSVHRYPAALSAALPLVRGVPCSCACRSFSRMGTPRRGWPSSGSARAASRASSSHDTVTALTAGFSRSIRAIAASSSSSGVASPRRTSAACSVAGIHCSSSDAPPMSVLRPVPATVVACRQ